LTNSSKVWDFMYTFGQDPIMKPTLPDGDLAALRFELIAEEVEELAVALADQDIVEIADALTDILYVTYGAGHAFGIDLDKCFEEVHRSNMSKLDENGQPIYREDGKVLKGPGYSQPRLGPIIMDGLRYEK